jgi:hypothetical protein
MVGPLPASTRVDDGAPTRPRLHQSMHRLSTPLLGALAAGLVLKYVHAYLLGGRRRSGLHSTVYNRASVW